MTEKEEEQYPCWPVHKYEVRAHTRRSLPTPGVCLHINLNDAEECFRERAKDHPRVELLRRTYDANGCEVLGSDQVLAKHRARKCALV